MLDATFFQNNPSVFERMLPSVGISVNELRTGYEPFRWIKGDLLFKYLIINYMHIVLTQFALIGRSNY